MPIPTPNPYVRAPPRAAGFYPSASDPLVAHFPAIQERLQQLHAAAAAAAGSAAGAAAAGGPACEAAAGEHDAGDDHHRPAPAGPCRIRRLLRALPVAILCYSWP